MDDARAMLLDARLELETLTAVPGGELGYTLHNTGGLPILFGESFGFERLVEDRWEQVALPYGFRAWGRRLEPGDRLRLSARVPEHVVPGHYRLRKCVKADWEQDQAATVRELAPVEVTVEFDVAGS